MAVLMPKEIDWSASQWISRGFFEDALALSDISPKIEKDIRFCVDAGIDTLDLRNVNIDVMRDFNNIVDKVINYRIVIRGNDFHLPEYFPVYMSKLEELRNSAHEVLDKMT